MKKKSILIAAFCFLISSVSYAAPVPDWSSDSICTAVASTTLYTAEVMADANGRNIEGNKVKTDTFSYEVGGKRLQHIVYDESSKAVSNTVYEYAGNTSAELVLTSIKEYRGGRNLAGFENVSYDVEKGLTTFDKCDVEGNLISKSVYTSDSMGRDVLAEVFDASGTLIERTETVYNDLGSKKSEKNTNIADGTVTEHRFEYDDDGRILKEIVSKDGVIALVMSYENDVNGNWIRKEVYESLNGRTEKADLVLSEVVYRLIVPYG